MESYNNAYRVCSCSKIGRPVAKYLQRLIWKHSNKYWFYSAILMNFLRSYLNAYNPLNLTSKTLMVQVRALLFQFAKFIGIHAKRASYVHREVRMVLWKSGRIRKERKGMKSRGYHITEHIIGNNNYSLFVLKRLQNCFQNYNFPRYVSNWSGRRKTALTLELRPNRLSLFTLFSAQFYLRLHIMAK